MIKMIPIEMDGEEQVIRLPKEMHLKGKIVYALDEMEDVIILMADTEEHKDFYERKKLGNMYNTPKS